MREVSHSLHTVSDVVQGYARLYRRLYSVAAIEPSNPSNYQPTIVALARVIAAKLHSMDVERIVSSYDLIKSTDRSSLSGDTLQDYLVVRHNMASIANFDVRPAVEEWMRRRERRPRQDRDNMQQHQFLEHIPNKSIIHNSLLGFNDKMFLCMMCFLTVFMINDENLILHNLLHILALSLHKCTVILGTACTSALAFCSRANSIKSSSSSPFSNHAMKHLIDYVIYFQGFRILANEI